MMLSMRRKACGCLAAMLAAGILALILSPTAFADTDESTLKISKEPDKLVLQLGARWAGVEFELRTDAGIFPVPVVVNESGVLTMDLGGSTTYTLTCMESSVPIPAPGQSQEVDASQAPQATAAPDAPQPTPAPSHQTPVWPVIVFVAGLAAAGGAFIALQISKRRQLDYDDWVEDEEE